MDDNRPSLVSIIVPVYNCGNCLSDTIQGLLNQTYKNIEIILVDDGSTDQSYKICEQYQKYNSVIKAYTQKNKGPGSARNLGFTKSSGEYIMYADADDHIYPNAIDTLVSVMKNTKADCCIFGFQYIYPEGIKVNKPGFEYSGNTEEFMKLYFDDMYRKCLIHAPWNKIYRRQAIINVSYIESHNILEDISYCMDVLTGIHRISVINEILYDYNSLNTESLIHKIYPEKYEAAVIAWCKKKKCFQTYGKADTKPYRQELIMDIYNCCKLNKDKNKYKMLSNAIHILRSKYVRKIMYDLKGLTFRARIFAAAIRLINMDYILNSDRKREDKKYE